MTRGNVTFTAYPLRQANWSNLGSCIELARLKITRKTLQNCDFSVLVPTPQDLSCTLLRRIWPTAWDTASNTRNLQGKCSHCNSHALQRLCNSTPAFMYKTFSKTNRYNWLCMQFYFLVTTEMFWPLVWWEHEYNYNYNAIRTKYTNTKIECHTTCKFIFYQCTPIFLNFCKKKRCPMMVLINWNM
jgi:hypothetical protein